jgi:hypothetical protein
MLRIFWWFYYRNKPIIYAYNILDLSFINRVIEWVELIIGICRVELYKESGRNQHDALKKIFFSFGKLGSIPKR